MKYLKGGSGVKIMKKGNEIIKSISLEDRNRFEHLYNQFLYMKMLSSEGLTPEVYDCGFNTNTFYYKMKFEESTEEFNLNKVLDNLSKVQKLKYPVPQYKFETYLQRLSSHIKHLQTNELFWKLLHPFKFKVNDIYVNNFSLMELFQDGEQYMNINPSLCHGDLTIENIINDKFIDTNFLPNCWNHFMLDLAKLGQSLHYKYEETFGKDDNLFKINHCSDISIIETNNFPEFDDSHSILNERSVLYFETTHYLRMLKYKTNDRDFVIAYIRMCQCWEKYKEYNK